MADAQTDPLRWLVEVREHFGPAIELLNARGDLLLPVSRGDTATGLRRLMTAPANQGLLGALREAAVTRAVVFVHLDGLRIAVVALRDWKGDTLTLVLGERVDAGRDPVRRAELRRMGAWLARALARPGASPTRDAVRDWHELSVLHRMLSKVVSTGSVAAVMQAYVEALAIWADIDSRAYIEDRAGRFTLEVSLAGAAPDAAPRVIAADHVAGLVLPTRLDRTQAERLGFPADTDATAASLRNEYTATWLLVYLGVTEAEEHERLAHYHELLLPALHSASEVEASRLMWSMMQQLIGSRRSPREAAAEALGELEQAGLCTAAMLVLRRGRDVIMELGTPVPAGPHGTAWSAASVQHYTLAVPDPFEASLTLWRPSGRPFTGREARLGAIGASVLAPWTASVLRRGDLSPDAPYAATGGQRRTTPAEVPDASLLVIRPDVDARAEVRERWISEIRRRLRSADVAGVLASGEIGILLPGTGADEAHAVASRLRRAFGQQTPLTLLDGAPIGIATGRPQASDGYAMLRQARADAEGDSDEEVAPPAR